MLLALIGALIGGAIGSLPGFFIGGLIGYYGGIALRVESKDIQRLIAAILAAHPQRLLLVAI